MERYLILKLHIKTSQMQKRTLFLWSEDFEEISDVFWSRPDLVPKQIHDHYTCHTVLDLFLAFVPQSDGS